MRPVVLSWTHGRSFMDKSKNTRTFLRPSENTQTLYRMNEKHTDVCTLDGEGFSYEHTEDVSRTNWLGTPGLKSVQVFWKKWNRVQGPRPARPGIRPAAERTRRKNDLFCNLWGTFVALVVKKDSKKYHQIVTSNKQTLLTHNPTHRSSRTNWHANQRWIQPVR